MKPRKRDEPQRRRTSASGKEEPVRQPTFIFSDVPKPMASFFRSQATTRGAGIDQLCGLLQVVAGDQVRESCAARQFAVDSIFRPCQSSQDGAKPVDLVVVIDTSGSMADEAASLSAVADAAVQAAGAHCVSDLRVKYLGLEGTFAGTKFDTKLRDYLHSLGIADSAIAHRLGSIGQEDGGRAIQDVSRHFDWRPGALRAILFLGDEPLEAGSPQMADDVTAADGAIAAANAATAKVSTYAGTGIEQHFDSGTGLRAQDEYTRVATQTGGRAYSAASGDLAEFATMLEETICGAGGVACTPAQLPELRPCLSLGWGEGPNDHIETDDVEVLCLTARNPYTNVTFRDMTLHLVVLDPTFHRPPTLPDGTPSVQIKPDVMICFGDIGPCSGSNGLSSTVSRELVMINRGAQEGTYYVLAAYCYRVELNLAFGSIFPLDVVTS